MFAKKSDSQAEEDQAETLPKAAALPDAAKIAKQHVAQLKAVAPQTTSTQPEATSCISSSMTVVGKIIVDGSVIVYGRIEGELQASDVVICEGAQVEGNIVSKELAVGGRVNGTIHAVRVKLHNTAVVEGDILHQLLVVEENARFEGMARRENNLTNTSASVHGKILDA
jgi:cytoskeletal protein CcmA (bactofilin family)